MRKANANYTKSVELCIKAFSCTLFHITSMPKGVMEVGSEAGTRQLPLNSWKKTQRQE